MKQVANRACFMLVSSALKIEEKCSSETSVKGVIFKHAVYDILLLRQQTWRRRESSGLYPKNLKHADSVQSSS
jgi:hypothetical protein